MREQKIPFKVILAVIATGLMSFCGVIVETSMNISFPTLMKEFNVTTSTVQWMTTIYLLVVAIIVPLSSFLKKNFKTKSLFLCANLLFILGLVIDANSTNIPNPFTWTYNSRLGYRNCFTFNVQYYFGKCSYF